jgi:hypothetical protein
MKSLQVNPAIRKHKVFKPRDWKVSSQPCNQEAQSFQTWLLGNIKSTLQSRSTKFSTLSSGNPVKSNNQEGHMSILQLKITRKVQEELDQTLSSRRKKRKNPTIRNLRF